MTLKEYILHWQEVYDKNQSRPTTYAAHGYLFKNHIIPRLGEIPLEELTVENIGDFLEERRWFGGHRPESPEYPGLGEHTMRHIHRLLQQCLDQAIRDGLITDNPARAFRYFRVLFWVPSSSTVTTGTSLVITTGLSTTMTRWGLSMSIPSSRVPLESISPL